MEKMERQGCGEVGKWEMEKLRESHEQEQTNEWIPEWKATAAK